MKSFFVLIVLGLTLVFATPMRSVTDHLGHTVQVPLSPKRIASLHTMSSTAILLEMNVPMIGTATRLNAKGKPYLRGAYEILGATFDPNQYFNYGKHGTDLEQISLSKPDLILANTRHSKLYGKLSQIAPTLIIDHKYHDLFEIHKDIADWIGEAKAFDVKHQAYLQKLKVFKKHYGDHFKNKTFVYAVAKPGQGEIVVRQHYAGLTKVLYDLGVVPVDFVRTHFKSHEVGDTMSAEIMGELDAYWFFSSYRNQHGDNLQSVYQDFDDVAMGWRFFVDAYKQKRFVALNREKIYPPTFATYDYVLATLEAFLKAHHSNQHKGR